MISLIYWLITYYPITAPKGEEDKLLLPLQLAPSTHNPSNKGYCRQMNFCTHTLYIGWRLSYFPSPIWQWWQLRHLKFPNRPQPKPLARIEPAIIVLWWRRSTSSNQDYLIPFSIQYQQCPRPHWSQCYIHDQQLYKLTCRIDPIKIKAILWIWENYANDILFYFCCGCS